MQDRSEDTGQVKAGGDLGSQHAVLAAATPQGSHRKEMNKDTQFATRRPPRKGASVCTDVGCRSESRNTASRDKGTCSLFLESWWVGRKEKSSSCIQARGFCLVCVCWFVFSDGRWKPGGNNQVRGANRSGGSRPAWKHQSPVFSEKGLLSLLRHLAPCSPRCELDFLHPCLPTAEGST